MEVGNWVKWGVVEGILCVGFEKISRGGMIRRCF